jgi:uncharacterized RDD family membrane protein YckC
MKYVGLSRRLFAYILDGLIYLCLIGLSQIVFGAQSTLFSKTEAPAPVAISYFIFSILYLIDQIVLPTKYGFTISRWICGYRIKRKDGDNPTFKQAVIRFFSIWLIEFLTIGIITFITSIFRKDKAAIHDIISKSYAVFPEDRHRFILVTFLHIVFMMYLLSQQSLKC